MSRRAVAWLISLLGLWSAATAVRFTLGVTNGLHAEYFPNATLEGPPAITTTAPEISTESLMEPWNGSPPETFSVRWTGFLIIPEPGSRTFTITSDDGAVLSVDQQVVVDNSGTHGAQTQTGGVWLGEGPHAVALEYVQNGGGYALTWGWSASAEEPASSIPESALTTERRSSRIIGLAGVIDRTRTATVWALVLSVLFLACAQLARVAEPTVDSTGAAPDTRNSRAFAAASLALFAVLAVVHTWPLASSPGTLSRNDNGDTLLNEWALAWFAHQLPRAPLQLYEANIFYPARHTLAYSEALIVQSAMGAPLLWLGASPVLTYNLVLLAGFALTGWTMCLVVTRWTGDRVAGVLSGVIAGVSAHTLTRLPHLQAQHVEFLPLALLALDAVLREPKTVNALRLALWFTLQALTSVYLMLLTAAALIGAAAVRPSAWWGPRLKQVAPRLGLAAGLSVLVLLPFMIPYWRVYQEQGLSRSIYEVMLYSASWADYVTTPGRFHYTLWSHRWATETALFPGGVGLLLTAVALGSGVGFRDPRARMCLAAGLLGVWLSFGPKLPGYATLFEYVPPLRAIRAADRFGYLATIAVAVLAGYGLRTLRQRLPSTVVKPLSIALIVMAALEPLAAPLTLAPFGGISPIYSQLRYEPNAIVVEMPFQSPRAIFGNAPYMLNSTAHWRPMLNGYSGFVPAGYGETFEAIGGFPTAESIAALQRLGVTHVVVHLDQLSAGRLALLNEPSALRRMSADGPIALYRLDPAPQ